MRQYFSTLGLVLESGHTLAAQSRPRTHLGGLTCKYMCEGRNGFKFLCPRVSY
jgi:hypothetical protein